MSELYSDRAADELVAIKRIFGFYWCPCGLQYPNVQPPGFWLVRIRPTDSPCTHCKGTGYGPYRSFIPGGEKYGQNMIICRFCHGGHQFQEAKEG